MQSSGKGHLFYGVVLILSFLVFGCGKSSPSPSIKPAMLDAYAATVDLFRYVWSEQLYNSPSAAERIPELLTRLIDDFHNVDTLTKESEREPGFAITLNVQRDMLKDTREHFESGDKDYARWRLRGVLSNCVSCHARYQVKSDFVGDIPISEDANVENRFSRAEFLLATRQFESAGKEFYQLAESLSDLSSGERHAFSALKRWLVVEVRVKQRPEQTAQVLEKFIKKTNLAEMYSAPMLAWKADLVNWAKEKSTKDGEAKPDLTLARRLLASFNNGVAEEANEQNLVKTLRATAILHQLLETNLRPEERRVALLELAKGYLHISIGLFEPFRELYLEQCIREFPLSKEAREAFVLYKDYIELISSGSGGINLDKAQQEKIAELRKLAIGK